MAAYCGSIGSVNVLEFVSTDLFDESQENPFLLQQQCGSAGAYSSPLSKLKPTGSPLPRSPNGKHQSVRFAELPLADQSEEPRGSMSSPTKATKWSPQSSPTKRQSAVPYVTGSAPGLYQQPPPPSMPSSPHATVSFSPPGSPLAQRPSITIQLPYPLLQRQASADSNASTMASQSDHDAFLTAEEAELHKLLYSLSRLGLAQPPPLQQPPAGQPSVMQYQSQQPPMESETQPSIHGSYSSTMSAPTSPTGFSSSSLWLPSQSQQPQSTGENISTHQPTGTASLMFRSLPSRQSSRRASNRQSKIKRFSSAPNSPQHQDGGGCGFFSEGEEDESSPPLAGTDYGYGSQPSSPQAHNSRGSVTFLTVKNLLRGGGALARTVRHEQPNRRPTCYGTVSSRLKRRQKFQRPTVITDAYHRVSDMKLGTSPMKVKIKHIAFPQTFVTDQDHHHTHEADPDMPSPKGQLRRESLITLETLDKIGTRHACPVQLIEEPLPDFSNIQPRVDAWNHYKKPKAILRRPSAWLLGATATSTPHGLHD